MVAACESVQLIFNCHDHIPEGNKVKLGTPLSVANVCHIVFVELPATLTTKVCSAPPDGVDDNCLYVGEPNAVLVKMD